MTLSLIKFSILSFAIVLYFFSKPTYSTSRKAFRLTNPTKTKLGFRVKLEHVDHGLNLTSLERIQRGIIRGRSRLQRLKSMVMGLDPSSVDVDSEVHSGNGEYLMTVAIGTPPNQFTAIMDTGSDLVWTQCKPCLECFDQSTPIFDPDRSSTFSYVSCSSQLCQALPSSACDNGCEYSYSYGDYSSTQGILAAETFTFGSAHYRVSLSNIGFGCGTDNQGDGFNQGAGLVGLGRGPLSLVSQLYEPKFSYCLTPVGDGSKSSTLLMGSLANLNSKFLKQKINPKPKTKTNYYNIITTPLLRNPSQPSFYYLDLQGISVGNTRLPISPNTFALKADGSGGLIIDSGTTVTYLEQSAYDILKYEFAQQMNLPIDNSGSSGLDLCFQLPGGSSKIVPPKLVFHFRGVNLELPSENYMIGDANINVVCLAMASSTGMSIFGNVQQQNFIVLHDLADETVSFVPTQCHEL